MLICFANSQMRVRYKQFHVRMDVFICDLYLQTVVHEQNLTVAVI